MNSDSGNGGHITRHRARRTVILLSELVFWLCLASFQATLHGMKPLAIAIVLAALILTFGHSLDMWAGRTFFRPPWAPTVPNHGAYAGNFGGP